MATLTELKQAIILLEEMQRAVTALTDTIVRINLTCSNSANNIEVTHQGTLAELKTIITPILNTFVSAQAIKIQQMINTLSVSE